MHLRRPRRGGWSACAGQLLAAVAAVTALPAPAADRPDPFDAPVTAVWKGLSLRAWATRAGDLAGRPVVVDRRLDPETPVEGDAHGDLLSDWLAAAAAAAGGAVDRLESSVRIVPGDRAGLAEAADEARRRGIARLPATDRGRLAERRPWAWPDGARPRDLVATAAAEAGVSLASLERIPHDHLPASAWPPLALAERLDLVLAHYDLRVAWAAGPRGTVVAIDSGLPAAAKPPATARPTRRSPQPPPAGAAARFTLRLEAPLAEAVRAIAPRLGLQPEIDRESLAARGIHPDEIVRADVKDASREELLDAIAGPLGLRWRIEGPRLLIDAPGGVSR